jgi:hypothetical protein
MREVLLCLAGIVSVNLALAQAPIQLNTTPPGGNQQTKVYSVPLESKTEKGNTLVKAQSRAKGVTTQLLPHNSESPDGYIRCLSVEHELERQQNAAPHQSFNEFEIQLQQKIQEVKAAKYGKHANARSYGASEVLQIPVIVHVVHNGETAGNGSNISAAQIQSQIDVLNEDFRKKLGSRGYNTHPDGADTKIEFVMAKVDPNGNLLAEEGIHRYDGGVATWNYRADIENTLKPATIWDPTRYLNMWTVAFGTVPTTLGGTGGLLGYAQFPETGGGAGITMGTGGCAPATGAASTDGVVMLYNVFGSLDADDGSFTISSTYDLGRTTTHEVGHWLGLRHIWGDGDCSTDDYCGDTPQSDAANTSCNEHFSCGSRDMVENYMDYTNDECMNIFTNDQTLRMRTVLTLADRRRELLSSTVHLNPSSLDATITKIYNPANEVCSNTFSPQIEIRNLGTSTLTSATITYSVDGGSTATYNWTGSLAIAESEIVNLTSVSASGSGSHTFTATISNPNGGSDENSLNNALTENFYTAGSGQALPFYEDFENVSQFPYERWSIDNPDECISWSHASNLVNSEGNRSSAAVMGYFYYPSGVTTLDYLNLPALDLTATNNISLEFDVAYARSRAEAQTGLYVEISTDCGATYTTVYGKTGSTLATTSDQSDIFVPSNASEWRAESIDLSAYANQTVLIRLVGRYFYGNNIYVDNLVIKEEKPEISLASTGAAVTESSSSSGDCRGYTDYSYTLTIDSAPATDVEVNVTTTKSTATESVDYDIVGGPITFAAGSTANQTLTVRVYDDAAIEEREEFILGLSIANGAGEVSLNPVKSSLEFILFDDDQEAQGSVTQTDLFTETFTGGLDNAGWGTRTFGGTRGNNNWTINGSYALISDGSGALSYSGTSASHHALFSPAINISGTSEVIIEYDVIGNGEISGSTLRDYGVLYYSFNGANFNPLHTLQGYTSWTTLTESISINSNTTIYLAWLWENNGTVANNPPLAIDNIVVYRPESAGDIPESSVTSSSVYFGPYETVNVYSPDGELVATLENTSQWNYGCTTVEIDRSGTSATEFWNEGAAQALTDKTITITPTNNSLVGSYNITLYYTEAELAGWETETGNSRNNIQMAKVSGATVSDVAPGSMPNGASGNVSNGTLSRFGAYYKLTARFATGFSSFGAGIPGDPPVTTLPVELFSFTASAPDSNIKLDWQSATEENVSHYEVEHSINGRDFEYLTSKAAAGNSSTLTRYGYMHKNQPYGLHYYRLKMVDNDGSYEYSETINVQQTLTNYAAAAIFPNPAEKGVPTKLTLEADRNESLTIRIMNIHGTEVLAHTEEVAKGANTLHLRTHRLAAGMYIVEFTNSQNQRLQQKLLIK